MTQLLSARISFKINLKYFFGFVFTKDLTLFSCHKTFKSQDDVYKHANMCHEIIEPLMCDKCNQELISKAGLKKHMERYKGDVDERLASSHKPKQQQSKDKCTNGPKCRFLKEKRCLFVHKEQNKKHSDNEHRRNPEWSCYNCKEKFSSRQEKHSHKCQQHDAPSVEERRKNTECKRGQSCFRLAQGSCWFKHSSVQNRKGQQGHRSAGSNGLWCRYQDQCTTKDCSFKHFEQGFPTRKQTRRN